MRVALGKAAAAGAKVLGIVDKVPFPGKWDLADEWPGECRSACSRAQLVALLPSLSHGSIICLCLGQVLPPLKLLHNNFSVFRPSSKFDLIARWEQGRVTTAATRSQRSGLLVAAGTLGGMVFQVSPSLIELSLNSRFRRRPPARSLGCNSSTARRCASTPQRRRCLRGTARPRVGRRQGVDVLASASWGSSRSSGEPCLRLGHS